MSSLLRTHPFHVAGAATVALGGLAWLAFGYFGVHTLVVDDVVSETAPVFDAPSSTTPGAIDTTSPRVASDDIAPPTVTPTVPSAATASPVVVEYEGAFVDESRYRTSGRAIVLGNGTGQRFLRFEGFATDNGPDLNVYLVDSSTGDVSEFVDLGDLSGNIGDQNYEIPADVDLEVYDRVVIWCVRFGVGFGSASLTAAA